MRNPHWPLFELTVRTPRLELRYVDDDLALELADLGARGVHDPATMPFLVPWTDVAPPEQQRNTLRHYWTLRGETTPQRWVLPLAVIVDGAVVGASSLTATQFDLLGSVHTGSWLGRAHHGRGLGTELRRATLGLGFAGLGAQEAHSGAMADNAASQGVSRKLGYVDNGRQPVRQRDERSEIVSFLLTRAEWERRMLGADIEVFGVEPCLELLGASPAPPG